MPDSPATQPEPQDPHEGEQEEPRPVFEGDWATASGVEKGEHSERVRKWKERTGRATPRGASTSGNGSVERSALPSSRAADRLVLESIRDDKRALPSDRIRAVEGLGKLDAQEHSATGGGDIAEEWRAMGDALALLPLPERLAFLREAAGLATATEEEGGGEASPRSDGTPT